MLALLTAGSLTEPGRKAIEKVLSSLSKFGLKPYLWQEIKLALSVLLLASLLIFRAQLPRIAYFFHDRGLERYRTGKLANAQSDFERAISLDPNNLAAHYNLGRLHENLQETKKAQAQYLIAAQGDFAPAYNELGRLSLQSEKLPEAAAFLRRAIELLNTLQDKEERIVTEYAVFKNLGWVRLKQKRYIDAETYLRKAIAFESKLGYIPASAHCLLAQVLEVEAANSPEKALSEWEICLSNADPIFPEEDVWLNLAQQRVDQK